MHVGILGLGKMGRLHAELFARKKNCSIRGLYNRSKEKAEALKNIYPGAIVYDTWQELIADKNIDIIAISTPQSQRLQQYKMAAEMGKHLFIEKPMCLSLKDLRTAFSYQNKGKVCFHVDSQIRNHPAILTVNDIVKQIGSIIHISLEFSMYREEISWKHKSMAGGGVLCELCGHLIDQAYDWLGEAKSIASINKIILPGREVEDFSINLLEYRCGATALITGNYFERKDRLYQGKIMGARGQIDFTFSSYNIEDTSVTLYQDNKRCDIPVNIPDSQDINTVYPGHMDSFQKEVDIFIEHIILGEQSMDTLIKEYRTTETILASYESTRRGMKVDLPQSNL